MGERGKNEIITYTNAMNYTENAKQALNITEKVF